MSLNDLIVQTMLEKGRAQAAGVAGAGQAMGQGLASLGLIPGGIQRNNSELQDAAIRQAHLDQLRQQQDDLKRMDAAFASGGGRDQIINSLPGHLQPTVRKQFADADEAAANVQKATLGAEQATNEYVGLLADNIAAHNNDPGAAQLAISHAKQTFSNNPSLVAQLSQFEQQLHANPTADTVKGFTDPILQARKQKEIEKAQAGKYAPGEVSPLLGPNPPAGPKIEAVSPGGMLVNTQTGAPTFTAPAKPSEKQSKSVLLDGKAAEVTFDPTTGKYSKPDTGEDVSGRVKPIPPASIQVNTATANALQNLPDWVTDSHRPVGPDANKFDKNVKMTPNGLYQAAITQIETGQYPPMGRGNDTTSQTLRAAVNAKVGAIAADAGMDVPTFRAIYNANKASLGQIQKNADAVQAFINTADKNSVPFEALLSKIPDVGSPLLNQPLRALSQKALGNVDMAQFRTYLQSIQNEYSRILTQPTLAGQLTDSARKEAETLLDPNATVAQQIASLQALRNEGGNRLASLGEQIGRIQNRLQNPTGQSSQPAAPPSGNTYHLIDGKWVKQ